MTPRGVGVPLARPGAPRFGSTQAFESPKPPSTPPVAQQPQFVGAPRRTGKSHLSSTVAFEVTPDELQKSIEDAAGRAQPSQPRAFQEERPPDTKSFGRGGEQERPRGTVGPVRTGKSHLSRTVAFFAEDDAATAQRVQQKVDEAAARVGRVPGPAAPPPLPPSEGPPSEVVGAAVIDVASTRQAPEPEHWHHPSAPSKEAALKMKLLTSRKKTMIGGVKLLDVLDAQREAQQASGEFAPPPDVPPVEQPPPPPFGPPPGAPFGPPPAAPPPGGPPPGERSQPFLAPHPLGVQRRGTMLGMGKDQPGPPPASPLAGPPPAGPPPMGPGSPLASPFGLGGPPTMSPPPGMGPPAGPPPGAPPAAPPSAPFAPPPQGPPPLLEPSPGPFPVPQPATPQPAMPATPAMPQPGMPQPPTQVEPGYGAAPGFGEHAPVAPMPAAFTPPPSSLTIPKKKTSVFVYVMLTIIVMVLTAGATLFYLFFR